MTPRGKLAVATFLLAVTAVVVLALRGVAWRELPRPFACFFWLLGTLALVGIGFGLVGVGKRRMNTLAPTTPNPGPQCQVEEVPIPVEQPVHPLRLPPVVRENILAHLKDLRFVGGTVQPDHAPRLYRVHVVQFDRRMWVVATEDGTVQRVERELPCEPPPKLIRAALAGRYPQSEVRWARAVFAVNPDGGETHTGYAVELMKPDGVVVRVTVAAVDRPRPDRLEVG